MGGEEKAINLDKEKDNKTIIFYLMIGSVSFLFIGLICAYAYTIFTTDSSFESIPLMFFFNTLLIISVSIILRKVSNESFKLTQKYSQITLYLIIAFFIGQCIAWWELIEQVDAAVNKNGLYFLYLLSIVHSLHIIGGIPFHINYLFKSRRYEELPRDEQLLLEYQFDLMHLYWHFLDGLWLILMILFIINMF